MTTNINDGDEDEEAAREIWLNVRILVTGIEEERFRIDQGLGPDEPTRAALAGMVYKELLGLGLGGQWWSQVKVR